MSIAKVIEVLAEGECIEAAIEAAAREASKTVRNIRHIYVSEIQAFADGATIQKYRVNCKVTFVVGSGTDME